jgi:hypothetical protein
MYPRTAVCSHHEALRVDLGIIVERQDAGVVGVAPNMYNSMPQNNANALAMETPRKELPYLRVFMDEQALSASNQGDIGAVKAEHLSNLDCLALSPQDGQLLRDSRGCRGLSVGPVPDI